MKNFIVQLLIRIQQLLIRINTWWNNLMFGEMPNQRKGKS